jgi:hypothetical protein
MSPSTEKRSSGYEVRIPAGFYKDETISLEAKALFGVIVAYADANTRETYVSNHTLSKCLGRGRAVIERALNELYNSGWLYRKRQRALGGRWGPRFLVWQIPEPDRCSNSLQRCVPAAVQRATCHIPGEVRSLEETSSFSSEELTDAQKSSNGVTDSVEEVLT